MAASVGILEMSRMQDRRRICGSLQHQINCQGTSAAYLQAALKGKPLLDDRQSLLDIRCIGVKG